MERRGEADATRPKSSFEHCHGRSSLDELCAKLEFLDLAIAIFQAWVARYHALHDV